MTNALSDTPLANLDKPNFSQALEALRPEITAAIANPQMMHAVVEKVATVIEQGCATKDTTIENQVTEFFLSLASLFKNDEELCAFMNKVHDIPENKDNLQASYMIHTVATRVITRDVKNFTQEIDAIRRDESPMEVRYQKLNAIRPKLYDLIKKKTFLTDKPENKRENEDDLYRRITVEDIPHLEAFDYTYIAVGEHSLTSPSGLEEIVTKIKQIEREYELFVTVGHVDEEKLEEHRMKFGAKGANLIALTEFMQKLQASEYFQRKTSTISIPPFQLVLAEIYDLWKRGERDSAYTALRNVYDAVQEYGSVMIRSSAVHSEDGKETTGAGIYESIFLKKGSTFEEFIAAVETVYDSCDSESAKQYRATNSIPNESMGLVIQKAIYDEEMAEWDKYRMEENAAWLTHSRGYINSTRPHSNNLMDIYYESLGFPLVYRKGKVEEVLFADGDTYGAKSSALYFEADPERMLSGKVNLTVDDLWTLATLLEKHYGRPVQIEDVINPNSERGEISVVQVRPLPSMMFTQQKIEFPTDIEPIAEMQAIGFCDGIFDILPPVLEARHEVDSKNHEKEGVVFFHKTFKGSFNMGGIQNACPKKGVVVLLHQSAHGRGHVESIALEKGLVLVFTRLDSTKNIESIRQIGQVSRLKIRDITSGAIKPGKLRIVANGSRARFYEVPVSEGEEVL